jgi:hypothetical protein
VFGVFGPDNYMSVDDLLRDLRIRIEEIAIGYQEFITMTNEKVNAIETKAREDAVKLQERY